MKKRVVVVGTILASALLFAACGRDSNSQGSNDKIQVTGQANDHQYQGVIQNGRYKTAKTRGVDLSQDSENQLNLKSFEDGMTELSQQQFSPKSYVFQEGQYLTKKTVTEWLERKSKDNPVGLNPPDNGQKDANKRNPMYVQQIGEQDYMKQDGNKLTLRGMTIGIGMNQKDYYEKEQYGPTFTTNIPTATMEEKGREAAQTVLARVRKLPGVGNDVPILIGMYKQAPNDSLVGGVFYEYAVSYHGTSLGNWKQTNLQNVVFPATANHSVPNSNDEQSFENFKNKIQNFFPNLAGVTAQARYKGKQIQGMKVTITTQFYSETEITHFSQYVAQAAKTYLPSQIPIDITVNGANGQTQSVITRPADGGKFTTQVLNSY